MHHQCSLLQGTPSVGLFGHGWSVQALNSPLNTVGNTESCELSLKLDHNMTPLFYIEIKDTNQMCDFITSACVILGYISCNNY